MRQAILAALIATATACFASDPPERPKVTGIYSCMTFNKEGGDVLGMELFFVLSSKGYVGVFQASEGEPTVPVIVPMRVEGTRIEFVLPPGPGYTGRFVGTIANEGISGSFDGGQQGQGGESVIHLKRGRSYWQ